MNHNPIEVAAPVTPVAPVAYVPQTRIESLDTIRGLAALAVLLGHSVSVFAWPMPLRWIYFPFINILFDGRSAVTIFFVLSGFVLSRPYLAIAGEAPRKLFVPTFYLRRIARIWIPWLFVFGLSIVAKAYLFRDWSTIPPLSEWREQFWHSPLHASTFFQQCIFNLHDARQQLIPQDWSLGVELKGSALIPVFLFLLRRHILLLLGATIPILVLLPTGEFYASFALGVLMARFYGQGHSCIQRLKFGTKLGVMSLGLLFYQTRLLARFLIPGGISNTQEKVVWCVASVGCVMVILGCLSSRRIQAMLNHSAMVFLGRISYSVYLLQFAVLLCALPPIVQGFNVFGIRNGSLIFGLAIISSIVVTSLLASLVYKIVEVPSVKCGRWLTKYVQHGMERLPILVRALSV